MRINARVYRTKLERRSGTHRHFAASVTFFPLSESAQKRTLELFSGTCQSSKEKRQININRLTTIEGVQLHTCFVFRHILPRPT